jgi:hypothetical protein
MGTCRYDPAKQVVHWNRPVSHATPALHSAARGFRAALGRAAARAGPRRWPASLLPSPGSTSLRDARRRARRFCASSRRRLSRVASARGSHAGRISPLRCARFIGCSFSSHQRSGAPTVPRHSSEDPRASASQTRPSFRYLPVEFGWAIDIAVRCRCMPVRLHSNSALSRSCCNR